ncbi:MAG: hypothetical protein KGI71_05780 [Patescibacteria group bacterium]|nr:hypothetical protein [Patescibacteria group bacterium]
MPSHREQLESELKDLEQDIHFTGTSAAVCFGLGCVGAPLAMLMDWVASRSVEPMYVAACAVGLLGMMLFDARVLRLQERYDEVTFMLERMG